MYAVRSNEISRLADFRRSLFDASGRTLGLIAVIGRRPLADPPTAESVLRIFAVRAVTELEGRRDRGVPAAR